MNSTVNRTKKMKINTKNIVSKINAAKKSATKGKVTTTNVAKKVAEAIKSETPNPFATHKAYNRSHCQTLSENGLGANLARCGTEILDGLVTELIENREKLSSTKLAASDKALLIESPNWKRTGPRLFAYPIVKAAGDVLEVKDVHAPKPNLVRVSLSALRKAYAPIKGTAIRIVAKSVAVAELGKVNSFKPSEAIFGVK